jgi:Carboxypeptidase regulatory-like domain/Gram-negative bacterial TonB protein C-terminal
MMLSAAVRFGGLSGISTLVWVLFAGSEVGVLGQEHSSVRGRVVNRAGDPVAGAAIELSGCPPTQAKYGGSSSADDTFDIRGIASGCYTIRISAPGLPTKSLRITIAGQDGTDLGSVKFGSVNCGEPGFACDDFGYLRETFKLPCLAGLDVLRDSEGSKLWLEPEELQQRAVRRVKPRWPRDATPGGSVNVYVVIAASGEVLCAAVSERTSPFKIAALEAARRWKFRPLLRSGRPVAAVGQLQFDVPARPRRQR